MAPGGLRMIRCRLIRGENEAIFDLDGVECSAWEIGAVDSWIGYWPAATDNNDS